MILSIEDKQEIADANNRLKLPELGDTELVNLLKSAQQHNPATGFFTDAAAVCAIRGEMQIRDMRKTSVVPDFH